MAYNILWTDDAIQDLDGFLHQFEQEDKPNYIQGLLAAINQLMNLLQSMPRLHPIWEDEVRVAPLPTKVPYTLYYQVNDDDSSILVIGLLHQRQDNTKIGVRY